MTSVPDSDAWPGLDIDVKDYGRVHIFAVQIVPQVVRLWFQQRRDKLVYVTGCIQHG